MYGLTIIFVLWLNLADKSPKAALRLLYVVVLPLALTWSAGFGFVIELLFGNFHALMHKPGMDVEDVMVSYAHYMSWFDPRNSSNLVTIAANGIFFLWIQFWVMIGMMVIQLAWPLIISSFLMFYYVWFISIRFYFIDPLKEKIRNNALLDQWAKERENSNV